MSRPGSRAAQTCDRGGHRSQARRQGAGIWLTYCRMLEARVWDRGRPSAVPSATADRDRHGHGEHGGRADCALAWDDSTAREAEIVAQEADPPSRAMAGPSPSAIDIHRRCDATSRLRDLLEAIGTNDDVPRLRTVAKAKRGRPATEGSGATLARRVAPRVFVEDQGRVDSHDRHAVSSMVRRSDERSSAYCASWCLDRGFRQPATRSSTRCGPTSIRLMR